MDINGKLFKKFLEREEKIYNQFSSDNAKKQHAKGKLTARERIDLLFDKDSFEEIDAFVTPTTITTSFGKITESFGDGVIVGHGKVSGRLVFTYAQDFTVMGGSLGTVHAQKISKIQEMALKMGAPIVGLID